MIELIEANWLLILLAVLVGFVVAWFLMSGSRKTKVTRDEIDEGDAGAKRNQALIDAPPAAAKDAAAPPADPEPAPEVAKPAAAKVAPAVPPVSTGMAGAGAATGVATGAAVAEKKKPAKAKAPAPGDSDDLTRLKGVGPKLVAQLHEMGITSFAQIAGWSDADIDRIDAQLGRFKGRIRRDDWVEQAKLLSGGDTAAYEARFGKL